MTDTTSAAELPEALQIAGTLEKSVIAFGQTRRGAQARAAAELRRLHARIAELEAQIAKKRVPDQEPFGYFRAEPFGWTDCAETDEGAIALYDRPVPPAVVEPPEMSPDFTDTARAALLWVLCHHLGGSSPVGQPIRFALGMGQHDRLNEHQLAEAKRWERLHPVNPAVWSRRPEPLSKEHRRALLDQLGDTAEGLDGDTWDQMVIDAVEAAHGIVQKEGVLDEKM